MGFFANIKKRKEENKRRLEERQTIVRQETARTIDELIIEKRANNELLYITKDELLQAVYKRFNDTKPEFFDDNPEWFAPWIKDIKIGAMIYTLHLKDEKGIEFIISGLT